MDMDKKYLDQMIRSEHIARFNAENENQIITKDPIEEVLFLLNELGYRFKAFEIIAKLKSTIGEQIMLDIKLSLKHQIDALEAEMAKLTVKKSYRYNYEDLYKPVNEDMISFISEVVEGIYQKTNVKYDEEYLYHFSRGFIENYKGEDLKSSLKAYLEQTAKLFKDVHINIETVDRPSLSNFMASGKKIDRNNTGAGDKSKRAELVIDFNLKLEDLKLPQFTLPLKEKEELDKALKESTDRMKEQNKKYEELVSTFENKFW
jgi:hypothetical protein